MILVGFDFDGVTTHGVLTQVLKSNMEVKPIIITGRTFEESSVIISTLINDLGFSPIGIPPIFYNPISLENRTTGTIKSRTISATHKASVLTSFYMNDNPIKEFYEDDPIQLDIIKSAMEGIKCPTRIIHVQIDDPNHKY